MRCARGRARGKPLLSEAWPSLFRGQTSRLPLSAVLGWRALRERLPALMSNRREVVHVLLLWPFVRWLSKLENKRLAARR